MLTAYKTKGEETNITKYLETITTNRSRDGATTYDAYEEDMAEVVFFFNREANSIGLMCLKELEDNVQILFPQLIYLVLLSSMDILTIPSEFSNGA